MLGAAPQSMCPLGAKFLQYDSEGVNDAATTNATANTTITTTVTIKACFSA